MTVTSGRSMRHARSGVTLVELLIVTALFLLLLGFLTSMFAGTTRAYRVTSERSEAIQDAEAVLQLIRYDLGRAGFRGVEDGAFDRTFANCLNSDLANNDLGSGASCQTVRVDIDAAGDGGDRITVRYFETRFIGGGTGERVIAYSVDSDESALLRREGDQEGLLLVGNIERLRVLDFVDRSREPFALSTLVDLQPVEGGSDGERLWPNGLRELAGLNVEVTFLDGSVTEFLVGLHNPQLFAVE